jgi:hypothetical protein
MCIHILLDSSTKDLLFSSSFEFVFVIKCNSSWIPKLWVTCIGTYIDLVNMLVFALNFKNVQLTFCLVELLGGISSFSLESNPFFYVSFWHIGKVFVCIILYITSLSLSVCQGVEIQITFNKTVPPNSRAQKLFRTSSFYFLLLFLSSFSRSNCQRSLFLIFIFTSIFAQQLSSSMGEVFLGFEGWVKRFGCPFFGLRI